MPQARAIGNNGPVRMVAVARRLREGFQRLVLRPDGPLPPLSRRGQLFDLLLALGLGVAALIAGDGDGDAERRVQVPVPDPSQPWLLPSRPAPDPFLPIEESQAGWTAVLFLIVVLPLIFRRRYPLTVLWIVIGMAQVVNDNDAAIRLSFYACVIAAYTAAVYSPYKIPALASLPLAAGLYTQNPGTG